MVKKRKHFYKKCTLRIDGEKIVTRCRVSKKEWEKRPFTESYLGKREVVLSKR